MNIKLSQLRRIIRETLDQDPRLTSAQRLGLASSLTQGTVVIEDELSSIEKSLRPVATSPDQKISTVVHEIVEALTSAREATSKLRALAARVKETSPHK